IGDSVDFWVPEFLDPAKRDIGDLDAIAEFRSSKPRRRWIPFPAISPWRIPKPTTVLAFVSSLFAIRCWADRAEYCYCCSPAQVLCSWSHAQTSRTCFWLAPQRARKRWPYARPSALRGFESCDSFWPSPH